MTDHTTFNCLSCGRLNPMRGANYTNKYCNNQCQQDHRKKVLSEKRINEWKSGCGLYVWKEVPSYIKDYLVQERGHKCEICSGEIWLNRPIPLIANQKDGDIYNNVESNLELICPNCKAQK